MLSRWGPSRLMCPKSDLDDARGVLDHRAEPTPLEGSRLGTRVEVCGGERAPRSEALAEGVNLLDRRRRIQPPGPHGRAAEREVGGGPDISLAERAHQRSIAREPYDSLDR